MLGIYSDRFEPYVPIADAALCAKVTKTAIAACHAALSDWASCQEGVVGSSYKITKAVCATTQDPKSCAATAKGQLETDKMGIEEALAEVDPLCDQSFAAAILEICLEGFHMRGAGAAPQRGEIPASCEALHAFVFSSGSIVAAKEQIMRRFSNVRHQLHRVFVTALLGLAVLALLGKAAHAQACGNILEQPEDVYDTFVGQFGLAFPLNDANACEKLAKAAVSACHKAVSDTASCQSSLTSSVYKGAKPVCSTFKNQSGCLDDAKSGCRRRQGRRRCPGRHGPCGVRRRLRWRDRERLRQRPTDVIAERTPSAPASRSSAPRRCPRPPRTPRRRRRGGRS